MSNTKRLTIPAIDNLIGDHFKALDHGFVRVIDYMGGDSSIVQAARVSYGNGTKTVNEDRGLIRYLMSHSHTTPIEMCELKLHLKMPIFVARQWIRHRTASVNEYSARYSIMTKEFYFPELESLQAQSKTNKQGREETISENEGRKAQDSILSHSRNAYDIYERLLNYPDDPRHYPNELGIARELARMVLPVNYYTEFYWKIDLHNLLHFVSLRSDPHAQAEIRVYSDIILHEIIKRWVPITYEAFEEYDHRRGGVKFSKTELKMIKEMVKGYLFPQGNAKANALFETLSKREQSEFRKKIGVKDV